MKVIFVLGTALVVFGFFLLHPGLGCLALGSLLLMWGLPDDKGEVSQSDEHKPTFSKQ